MTRAPAACGLTPGSLATAGHVLLREPFPCLGRGPELDCIAAVDQTSDSMTELEGRSALISRLLPSTRKAYGRIGRDGAWPSIMGFPGLDPRPRGSIRFARSKLPRVLGACL
jgi:hypothetical protein